jgi:hypothetical protein
LLFVLPARSQGDDQTDTPASTLRDAESGQEQARNRTLNVAQQIDGVLAELDSNGLSDPNDDDIKTLHAVRGALGQLSDDEMQRVVSLLQQAQDSKDAASAKDKAAGAFAGQKQIIAKLRALLLEYQQRASLQQLADRFEKLADRQNNNLKSAVTFGRQTIAKPVTQYDPSQKDALHAQQIEQQQIQSQTAQALADLNALAAANGNGADDRVKQAMAAAKQQDPTDATARAANSLANGNPLRAASDEKAARDQLRQLADLVGSPKDDTQQLRDADAKLDQDIRQEQEVIDAAASAKREQFDGAEYKQAELVDDAETIRRNLATVSPAAAGELANAESNMQDARGALNARSHSPAVKAGQAALDHLQAAKAEVDRQLGKTDQTAQANQQQQASDPLAAAKAMQQQAAELQRQQQALAAQTTSTTQPYKPADIAAKQAELQQQTRELEADAAKKMPEVAKSLDSAAQQMDAAQRDLTKGRRRSASKDQQAAADALGQAQQQVDQQTQAIAQAQQDQKQLEAARDQIADAMIKQAEAYEATIAPPPPTTAPTTTPSAAEAAAAAQQAAADAAAKAQQQMPASTSDAASQPLQQAQQAMAAAKQDLSANNSDAAAAQQRDALTQLSKAKSALDDKLDQAEQQAGSQNGDDQSASAAQKVATELKAAQEEVQAAQADLAQAGGQEPATTQPTTEPTAVATTQPQPQDQQQQANVDAHAKSAARHLEKAAAAAAKASAEDRKVLVEAAKQTLKEAQKQLDQAIENAKQNQSSQAQANAQQAQEALARAEAAANLPANGNGPPQPPQASSQQQPSQQKPGQPNPQAGDNSQQQQQQQQQQASTAHQVDSQNAMSHETGGSPDGPRADAHGPGQYLGLPPRDRQAIQQSQSDKYPPEYGAMVEQYYRNLSDEQGK